MCRPMEAMMTQRATSQDDTDDLVNAATPTNEPGPTPADNSTGPEPDDRGKTTQTGDASDVPGPVRRAMKEKKD